MGGRKGPAPTRRDIQSRGLVATFDCSDAQRDLGWQPTRTGRVSLNAPSGYTAGLRHAVKNAAPCLATFRVGGPQTRFASLVNQFGGDYRHIVVAMDGISDAIGMVNPEVQLELLPLPLKRGRNIPNVPLFRRVLRRSAPICW